jgi:hypothetical protein
LIAHAWLASEVLIGEFEVDRYAPLVAPHLQGGTLPQRQTKRLSIRSSDERNRRSLQP